MAATFVSVASIQWIAKMRYYRVCKPGKCEYLGYSYYNLLRNVTVAPFLLLKLSFFQFSNCNLNIITSLLPNGLGQETPNLSFCLRVKLLHMPTCLPHTVGASQFTLSLDPFIAELQVGKL